MKRVKLYIFVAIIFIMISCINETTIHKPNKKLVKKHVKLIELVSTLKIPPKYEIIDYKYWSDAGDFSINFTLKVDPSETLSISDQINPILKDSITNEFGFNSMWTLQDNVYGYYSDIKHMDYLDITVIIDSNLIRYTYFEE